MIGVIASKNQRSVVEEFFQLFKTPWEFYRPEATYDVVLAADEPPQQVEARLLVVYGALQRDLDQSVGVRLGHPQEDGGLIWENERLPLYCDAVTFVPCAHQVICGNFFGKPLGLRITRTGSTLLRFGFDLFAEIEFLLTTGQPVKNALVPSLDLHIALLRRVILEAGIPLIEVPPVPAGYDFAVCLTHDIDFVGIRRHKFDHTMWGFLYRCTVGSLRDFIRGRLSLSRMALCWRAAVSLPFVFTGWAKDFWMLFDWYLAVEKGLSSTYFFIPFKHRPGERVRAAHPGRRASGYDITDIPELVATLKQSGCEIGVHGLDAWHDASKGREELERVRKATGVDRLGIRMHWLLRDPQTIQTLEQAGYAYDSTSGYNETPGYFAGTSQVFRPLSACNLLELPLHIQDGALFYPKRLALSDRQASDLCQSFIDRAREFGGVLTLLWHDRSPGPERFWGGFYEELVAKLKSLSTWFAHAGQAVCWFRNRRSVRFEQLDDGSARIRIHRLGRRISPPLRIQVHSSSGAPLEHVWDGTNDLELSSSPVEGGACLRSAILVA